MVRTAARKFQVGDRVCAFRGPYHGVVEKVLEDGDIPKGVSNREDLYMVRWDSGGMAFPAPGRGMFLHKPAPPTVIEEVAAMREKQISKGYDADHDDTHDDGILSLAGAHLALPTVGPVPVPRWVRALEQENTRRERLIIATSFLIAEVERMDRAEVSEGGGQ